MAVFWVIGPIALLGLAIGATAGVAWLIALWRSRKSGRPARSATFMITGGCGLLPFAFLLMLVLLPAACNALTPSSMAFEEVFGAVPDADFAGLKSSVDGGWDSRTVYLAWDTSAAAVDRLDRLLAGSQAVPETDMLASAVYAGSAPPWFRAGPTWLEQGGCDDRTSRELRNWRGWDDLTIVECRSDGRTYVIASSVD